MPRPPGKRRGSKRARSSSPTDSQDSQTPDDGGQPDEQSPNPTGSLLPPPLIGPAGNTRSARRRRDSPRPAEPTEVVDRRKHKRRRLELDLDAIAEEEEMIEEKKEEDEKRDKIQDDPTDLQVMGKRDEAAVGGLEDLDDEDVLIVSYTEKKGHAKSRRMVVDLSQEEDDELVEEEDDEDGTMVVSCLGRPLIRKNRGRRGTLVDDSEDGDEEQGNETREDEALDRDVILDKRLRSVKRTNMDELLEKLKARQRRSLGSQGSDEDAEDLGSLDMELGAAVGAGQSTPKGQKLDVELEDDVNEEELGGTWKKRHEAKARSRARVGSDSDLEEDLEDFIDDDDIDEDMKANEEELLQSPGMVAMKMSTSPEDQVFKVYLEFVLRCALEPNLDKSVRQGKSTQHQIYRVAIHRIEAKLKERRDLCISSAAWLKANPDLLYALEHRPYSEAYSLGHGERECSCDACGRHRDVSKLFILSGTPVDEEEGEEARERAQAEKERRRRRLCIGDSDIDEDLEDIDNDEEEEEEEEERRARRCSDSQRFYLGRYCAVRMTLYHLLTHFARKLAQRLNREYERKMARVVAVGGDSRPSAVQEAVIHKYSEVLYQAYLDALDLAEQYLTTDHRSFRGNLEAADEAVGSVLAKLE